MLTSSGEIVVELETAKAPITVANFLKYVQDGYYSNTIFHRVVPGFVVQGGGFTTGYVAKAGVGAAIKLESNVGLSNVRGTIAMARTSVADSATSQFYFNTVDNATLNYKSAAEPGYAVFGRVISGLGTIDKINAEPQLYSGAETPATEVLLYWAIKLK
jgi:cyclophilin family peptidyl-prolyl cis-trans isomerase